MTGFSPADLWTAWAGSGAPGGFPTPWGGSLPGDPGLPARLARLRSSVPPELVDQLSSFDRTRLARALEQLESLQGGGLTQSGGFTASQRIRNLQGSIGRILGTAEKDLMARRLAAREASLAIQEHRAAAAAARQVGFARFLTTGATVTVGAVILIVLVGLAFNRQQQEILDRVRNLPEDAEPATIFVGPAAGGSCQESVFLENGLAWTDQGWRAPLTLPEPMLYGDFIEGGSNGDRKRYRAAIERWLTELYVRVDEASNEAIDRCDIVPPAAAGTCSETFATYTVWKPRFGTPDSYVLFNAQGTMPPAAWEWEIGYLDEAATDLPYDVLVARLAGTPGTAVCVGYRYLDASARDTALATLAVDEETAHWTNTGCYWEIGIENEDGLKSIDQDYESTMTGKIGTDGNVDLRFAEVSCSIGVPAHSLLRLEITADPGAGLHIR